MWVGYLTHSLKVKDADELAPTRISLRHLALKLWVGYPTQEGSGWTFPSWYPRRND